MQTGEAKPVWPRSYRENTVSTRFTKADLDAIAEAFARRPPRLGWHGYGFVQDGRGPDRVTLFFGGTACEHAHLARAGEATFELARPGRERVLLDSLARLNRELSALGL
ncbi:MAG: hypothetical protein HXY22_13270 [Alphaproteobacteria bacterium]|nr:hypothetical protein [Alphaproteobacteria bacterium]